MLSITDPSEYSTYLSKYEENINKKDQLIALDEWYYNELSPEIKEAKFISQTNLSKLMQWKLKRGKFRPSLQKYVDALGAEEVKEASKKSFALCDKGKIEEAVKEITVLKGVGPATASAILSAYNDTVPFMSDEALANIEYKGSDKYTLSSLMTLYKECNRVAQTLNKKQSDIVWDSKMIEKCIYSYHHNDDVKKEAKKASKPKITITKSSSVSKAKTKTIKNDGDEGSNVKLSKKRKRKE